MIYKRVGEMTGEERGKDRWGRIIEGRGDPKKRSKGEVR
jgi:hypothetical protein